MHKEKVIPLRPDSSILHSIINTVSPRGALLSRQILFFFYFTATTTTTTTTTDARRDAERRKSHRVDLCIFGQPITRIYCLQMCACTIEPLFPQSAVVSLVLIEKIILLQVLFIYDCTVRRRKVCLHRDFFSHRDMHYFSARWRCKGFFIFKSNKA